MPKFSTYFNLAKNQAELDFVDVDTDADTPLFIDPYVFSQGTDPWSSTCHEAIQSFFQAVLDCIRDGDKAGCVALLGRFHEPNETCLGLSVGKPSGRGIGHIQADDLFKRFRQSRAAQTGLLEELSDTELFIDGIGPDKISDITTNIIRRNLIQYTSDQCALHGIPLPGTVASGPLWNQDRRRWEQQHVPLPVIDGRKIVLVPKASVRWSLAFSRSDYYDHFVLSFLQAEHLDQNTALVQTLKTSKRRRVTKKSLKELYPASKSFLADFSEHHPEVLARYKGELGLPPEIPISTLEEGFDEAVFAHALIAHLAQIRPGDADASDFHSFMVGALEFIFFPNLIYPKKEFEIHEGRKRIDIAYTNNARTGFFFRRARDPQIGASTVFVECKNYTKQVANPELDQMSGRFSMARGRLGFLIGRNFDDRPRFVARCRDTAVDGRGIIIALGDEDIVTMLRFVADQQRGTIDMLLEQKFRELVA